MERVSIITACLNAAAHLELAIKSVQAQSYPNIEYIMIDGGSTDGTLDIISRYQDDISYFVSEPDRGVYQAMNKGIQAATGDILFFLGADDYFCDEQVISDVVSVFKKKPDVAIVYGNQIWHWQGKMIRRIQSEVVTREILGRTTILHQTVFARRKIFTSTGGFSEHYKVVSDYEWMLKAFLRDRYNYYYYNRDITVMGTGGMSWTTRWESERIKVMRQYFSLYEILKYRIVPMKKKSLERTLKQFKGKIKRTTLLSTEQ